MIYCVEHSVLNRFVNTVNPTQCLLHINFNTVNELALRTRQLKTFFQHSVLGCCQKHCVTGHWRCARKPSFGTGCICFLLPTFGWALACGRRLVLTAHCRTLTGHRMPRCSFPEADINWSSNFSIHKRLSMCSCTTRTLHVSRAIAIPGYAAQVSVRAGSVIAHLSSLNRDGPLQTSGRPVYAAFTNLATM